MIKSSILIASFYNDGQRGSSYRQMFQLLFPFFHYIKNLFSHLSFLSNVSIFKNIPMIVMATISTAIPPSWMELGDFSSRYSTNRERERSSCDSSVEQISSHAYAHARPGSCQAMRRIRVANLYDKHFHRGQPVRVNTLVKKR